MDWSRNEYSYTLVQCKWIKGGSLVFWLDSYCCTYHNHSLLMSQLRRTFDNILVSVSRWSIASLKRQIPNIFDYYASLILITPANIWFEIQCNEKTII